MARRECRSAELSMMKRALVAAVLAGGLISHPAYAAPVSTSSGINYDDDPFRVLDPQNWVNPDNMTWADYKAPPGINWGDPSRRGSIRNFNIALIALDYSDRPFIITQAPGSTVFSNPQPNSGNVARADVPAFYRDLLNKPSDLNRGHTLHQYWMEDSAGRFGVDLAAFGPYELPSLSYQYGIGSDFNSGSCPPGPKCDVDLRTDAYAAWRAAVGNETASSFELVFILSAGQDESSTWQEFGEMKFQSPADVPESFGPPTGNGTNSARTRYVEWTSWASAATIWPNAGGGSSTQGESSGMAVYAHELSHLLSIGDNYNNPYGIPPRRSYTGPWSMMSRGSFNGPGGPHTRWKVPALQGASLGSLHTMRDKTQLGLASNTSILSVSREALASSGLVVARVTARAIEPAADGVRALRVTLDGKGGDRSPACNTSTDPYCDGGKFNKYDLEVVDRMGSDSFTPDSGVMISKTKDSDRSQPFQWTIDANPQDIKLADFIRPNGSIAYISIGDYRQLADALFHAGTRSGSQFEHIDTANRLHLYIIEPHRDESGVLSYTVGARSLDGSGGASKHGATLSAGNVKRGLKTKRSAQDGVACEFTLSNTGSYSASSADQPQHPQDISRFLKSDIYRLKATVEGSGWRVEVPNALATAEYGASTPVRVAVAADEGATSSAVITLTATSESDPSVIATACCTAVLG